MIPTHLLNLRIIKLRACKSNFKSLNRQSAPQMKKKIMIPKHHHTGQQSPTTLILTSKDGPLQPH